MVGAGLGIVDSFDMEGNFTKTFASAGTLNAPWGVVMAPATFGAFAGDVLIGNFGDGTMNAFDPTGKFIGQVTDSAGHVITNPGLWDLVFGAGGTGDPGTLYFTSGGANQTSGLFASLVPASAAGTNFSLNLSAQSVTVTTGGTAKLTIASAAVGGFNGQITLSCMPAAGLTCTFTPSSISPGSSTASSTLTIAAAAVAPGGGYGNPGMLVISGLGLFGTLLTTGRRKLGSTNGKSLVLIAILALLVAGTAFTVACGSNNSSKQSTTTNNPTNATVTVTGTSGALSHSVPVTVAIQ